MQIEPLKPDAVPSAAVYSTEHQAWELCSRDSRGRRHGECHLYREDGTLWMTSHYDAGRPTGAFTAYHPNGELLQRGQYSNGQLDGAVVKFVSEAPGAEPLRGCCVPPGATELRSSYRAGRLLRQVFHDRLGRPLASDGTPWPERVAAIPEDADFDATTGFWCARSESDEGESVRYFSPNGLLIEEITYREGVKRRCRRFDAVGLREERAFDAEGLVHGPVFLRHSAPGALYRDARIQTERGAVEHGQPTGVWRFFDAQGEAVCAVSRGSAVFELAASLERLEREFPADASAESLFAAARELCAGGRVREGLCLAARATALAGDSARFRALLAEHVVPLSAEVERERAEALTASSIVTPESALEALLLGADPAEALRTLASVLPGHTRSARDLVEAALLLAPDRHTTHLTRALIRLEHGDRSGALEDAAALAPQFEETARFVRDFVRIQFPSFGFWPGAELPAADPSILPVTIEQPLEAVRSAVFTYASRLARLRQALAMAGVEPAFLPPDLSAWLPHGPLELRRFRSTILDETEEGTPETSDVEIDETLDAWLGGSVSRLMLRTRADWAALCWLCWAVGRSDIGIPDSIAVPAAFPAAVNRTSQRCFRVHDRLRTGGLIAASQGIAGFAWEGSDIDVWHPRLVEFAAAEYLEIRAMLFWLLFAENVSPFQSDLRRV